MRDWITTRALGLGITVPLLYYGIQAVAAPFFPGFSVLRTIASDLGSDLSTCPWLFNGGIMLAGAACLVSSIGFLLALMQVGTHPGLAGLVATVVALLGMMLIWGGYYPLPNPRHEGLPVFAIGLVSSTPLLTASLWRFGGWVRAYLVASLALFLAAFPMMFGMTGSDMVEYRGLLQRTFAFAILPPIGVAAYYLARQTGTHRGSSPQKGHGSIRRWIEP
jgi:hypothetical membrane protein